jgi:zinc protease
MRFARYFVFFALVIVGANAAAMAEIENWTTSNGARVYFVPAHQIPMVDVRVVFDGGSARDGAKAGRALLANALLAEGAGKLDADTIASRFDDVGASFGNASLRDMALISLRTLTKPELMAQAVDTATLVLTQPTFPARAVERERSRVLISLQGEEQDPGAVASKVFFKSVYGDHPYAHPPMGDTKSMKALTRADLLAHYRDYYVGRNAVVAIVGDLNRPQAERLAEALVGKLPAGRSAPNLPPVTLLSKSERQDLVFPSTQTHILMGQPGMSRDDSDYFPLYVGNHILGGSGLVSRISEEVREKRGLAYSAYSDFTPMRLQGPFSLGLQTANANSNKALSVLRDTLSKFIAEGPTEKELTASKRNITGGFALAIDSNRDIVQFLANIGFYRLPLDYLKSFNSRVEAVTLEQIRDAFRRRVRPDAMVTITVGKPS